MRQGGGFLLAVSMAVLLTTAGCGSSGESDLGGGVDGYVFPEVAYDTKVPDEGGQDLPFDDAPQLDVITDPEIPPECPTKSKPAGCLCEDNDDCLYGFCMATEMGQICVEPCVDTCPSGWSCSSVEIGTEVFYLCLPRFSKLCQPCKDHVECQAKTESNLALCLDYGEEGGFCGAYCDDDQPCPSGYLCEDRVLGNGTETRQCVTKGLRCACNQLGKSLNMGTTCMVANEHGACLGERLCEADGLSDCNAGTPAAEQCDGQDNDCNGITDDLPHEQACFVENEYGKCPGVTACVGTVELCAGDPPKPEVCDGLDNDCNGHTDDGFSDLDGDKMADCVDPDMDGDGVANEVDNCIEVENPGQEDLDKDDKGDACDPDVDGDGFVDVTDCLPLDVLSFPGAQEQCDGKDNDCDSLTDEDICADDLDCTFDFCNPATGECGHAPDDGLCDDGDICTQDLCDPVTGCKSNPISGIQCDDGNLCTVGDTCEAGVCEGILAAGCCAGPDDCDDDNSCTTDLCDLPTGECSHVTLPDDSACDADGDGCTVGDTCKQGWCIVGPRTYCGDDDTICVSDDCVSTGPDSYECVTVHADQDTPCDDELFCTVDDHCDGIGACVGGGPRICPQQEGGCLVGLCDDDLDECYQQKKPDGEDCNADDDGCTLWDACVDGACVPGLGPDCSSAAGGACEIGVCDSLGPGFYTCLTQPKPEGTGCDNGDFCTVDDHCDALGDCVVGEPRDCNAEVGDQCHVGVCDDYLQACVPWKEVDGTLCDDGDVCTTSDVCANGFCIGVTDVCVAEKISVQHKGHRQPALVSLGSGRYVTQWFGTGGYGTQENRLRLSDAFGSRENEEVTLAPIKTGRQFETALASTATGNFLALHWGGINACVAVNCNPCAAQGSFTGHLYQWDGKLLHQKALMEYDLVTGTDCAAELEVSDARAVPLAFKDGTFGLLDAYDVTGNLALGDGDRPSLEIRYTQAASDLTSGTSVVLVAGTDVWMASGFDATPVPDGSDRFLLAWIDATGRQVKVQRLTKQGTAEMPAWTAVQVPEPEVIQKIRLRARSDGGFVVVYDTVADAGGLRFVRGRRFDAGGTPLGETFGVEPLATSDRRLGGLGLFSDGGFVVTYDAMNGDLDGWAARAQLFHDDGVADGAALVVNTDTIGDQVKPAVAVLDGDEWVVAFVDSDTAVWTRRFQRDGQVSVGRPELPANTTTEGAQMGMKLGLAGGNRVMAVYQSPQFGAEGGEILARVFDIQGHEILGEFTVNQTHVSDQRSPVVQGGDGFVVAWESEGQDGSGSGIFARTFDTAGAPLGDEFPVNVTTALDQVEPGVVRGPGGDTFFVWTSDVDGSGTDTDVFASLIEPGGAAIKGEFLVHTTQDLLQNAPAVVTSPLGAGYVVVWESENQDGYSYGVYARRFDAAGEPLTGEVLVNQTTVFPQRFPTLSVSPDGVHLAVCWTYSVSYTFDTVCRILNFADLSGAVDEFTPTVPSKVNQQEPHVAYLPNGEFLVGWSASDVDGSGTAVQVQRYTGTAQPFGPRIQVNRTFTGDQRNPFILPIQANLLWTGWVSFGQDGDQDGGVFRILPVQ